MDGRRGPAPGGDGVDDRLGPGHDIAAGEDAGAAGGERPRIGDDAGPAADLDPGTLGEDRRIGFLADGDEDRRRGQFLLTPRDGLPRGRRPGEAGPTRGRRTGLRAAEADDGSVTTDDRDRGEPGPDDDPLALGGLDLLLLGRHLRPPAPIDDRHRRRATPPCRSRGVHRRAPATDHDGRAGQAGRLAEIDPLQEQRRRDDPGASSPGHAEPPALRGAGREEDGAIALLLEVAQGEVPAHRGVESEVDAEPDDTRDLILEDVARQPVRRDPDGHHPARDRHRLEHGDGIPEAREVVGRRHPGRPAADDPDLLAPARPPVPRPAAACRVRWRTASGSGWRSARPGRRDGRRTRTVRCRSSRTPRGTG